MLRTPVAGEVGCTVAGSRCTSFEVSREVASVEVGLLIRYGKLVPGREHQAIDLFQQTMSYFSEKRGREVISYFEPFFFLTSDLDEELGFFVVRGSMLELTAITNDEVFKVLLMKAAALASHVQIDWLTVGQGIGEQVERSLKVYAELGV
jgi:hypothetical protein